METIPIFSVVGRDDYRMRVETTRELLDSGKSNQKLGSSELDSSSNSTRDINVASRANKYSTRKARKKLDFYLDDEHFWKFLLG